MVFEAILYVAREALTKKQWIITNNSQHISPMSYETGSNKEGWKKEDKLVIQEINY